MKDDESKESTIENTSGQEKTAIVPDEIKGWNWGAFFLGWMWGIGNHVWIALLPLILFVSSFLIATMVHYRIQNLIRILSGSCFFIVSIVLGINGNERAWRNKKWDSIKHFKKAQRTWAIFGTTLTLAVWLFLAVAFLDIRVM